VTPSTPVFASPPRKKLKIRPRRTTSDNTVKLVWLARMLTFLAGDQIHLLATRSECASIFAANSKQHNLSHISKVESNSTAVRTTVHPNFVPHQIRLLGKPPSTLNIESFRQQSVR